MTEHEKILKIHLIYQKLQDDESRKIFNARILLTVSGDRIHFWDRIKKGKKWYSFNLKNEEYFIFGAGKMGVYIKEQLEVIGKKVKAFLDNDSFKIGQVVDGIPVIKVKDAGMHSEIPVVFSSRYHEDEMKKQLINLDIKNPVIKESEVCLFCGTQYFDVFEPNEHEVFIDAGSYDGSTIKDFVNWCKGNYDMIYSFEPDKSNYDKCKTFIKENHFEHIRLLQKGIYDAEKILKFDASGDESASIREDGTNMIETTTIDSVLNGDRVTFIKMDVEGSEIKSLCGAEKIIKKYRPRLAICVYHEVLDFIKIPLLLLEMNPDYKFYLRHYASNLCETVLYAE